MANKMMKADKYNNVIEFMMRANADEWMIDFIKKEAAMEAHKRETTNGRVSVKKAMENGEIEEKIIGFLSTADGKKRTGEIAEAIGYNTPKITPRMKALLEAGKVSMIEDKKVKYYTIAD